MADCPKHKAPVGESPKDSELLQRSLHFGSTSPYIRDRWWPVAQWPAWCDCMVVGATWARPSRSFTRCHGSEPSEPKKKTWERYPNPKRLQWPLLLYLFHVHPFHAPTICPISLVFRWSHRYFKDLRFGFKVDAHAFGSMLCVCAAEGEISDAFQVYEEMLAAGYEADTSAIKALLILGRTGFFWTMLWIIVWKYEQWHTTTFADPFLLELIYSAPCMECQYRWTLM